MRQGGLSRIVLGVLVAVGVAWLFISSNRSMEEQARAAGLALSGVTDVRGIWGAQRYHLAGGDSHEVRGRIVFGEQEWQVLFFVMGAAGEPERGSGEGGTYTMRGDTVVFTHLFHLSAGDSLAGLPASALRMEARTAGGAEEPTQATIDNDVLTLFFPSGNRLTFRRIE